LRGLARSGRLVEVPVSRSGTNRWRIASRGQVGDFTKLRACVLGSGSSGNATLVATDQVRVLFDAGFSCRQIQLRLEAIGENYRELDAVVVSHEHSDHVKGLEVLARKTGVKAYTTQLTASVLAWKKSAPEMVKFEAGRGFSIGDLEIETFTVSHDAIDPVGFCARQDSCKLSIVTDLGYMTDSVRYHLAKSDLLVLESNHDLDMLRSGPYPWEIKQRVMSRDGHLSNTAVAEYLSRDWDRNSRTVVLAHLSSHNNHPAIAEMDARAALDSVGASTTNLLIASQDVPTTVFEL
jgi:phosphoribosyl 1,2-cyclic phosphodiesterase